MMTGDVCFFWGQYRHPIPRTSRRLLTRSPGTVPLTGRCHPLMQSPNRRPTARLFSILRDCRDTNRR